MIAKSIAFTMALAFFAAPLAHAATNEEKAVLTPIQALFDGMAKYDRDAMLAAVQPEGSVALLRNGKMVRMTLGDFANHIKPGKDKIQERIHDPLIKIDGDIAMVWAPYEFLINGEVKHCGTDVVNLVRQDGRWVISGIADNSRSICPAG
ncbi:MAG TPA: nuclear transport factor 2 family protein [Dyella sp.]|uniref:nuclear transport factor 2 family protein n=1 Tax=Dyella sp. TaxID=1869338 RepID=UPI002F92BA46